MPLIEPPLIPDVETYFCSKKHPDNVLLPISEVKSQKTQIIKLSKQSTINQQKHLVVEPSNFTKLQPLLSLTEDEILLLPTAGTMKCPENSLTQHPELENEKIGELLEVSKCVSYSSKHSNEYTKANDQVLKHLHPIQQPSVLLPKTTKAQPLKIAVQELKDLPIETSQKHSLTELSNSSKLKSPQCLSIVEPHPPEIKASNFQAVNTLPPLKLDPLLETINHLYHCLINLNKIKEELPGCYPDTSDMISQMEKQILSHFQDPSKEKNLKILHELMKQVNQISAIIFENNELFKLQKQQNILTFESENIFMPLFPVNSLIKASDCLTELPTPFLLTKNKMKQIPLPTELHNDNINQHNIVDLDQHNKVKTLENQELQCQSLLQSPEIESTKIHGVDETILNQELVSFVSTETANCSLVKKQKLTDVTPSILVSETETLQNVASETNNYTAVQSPQLAVVEVNSKQNPLLPPMQCINCQNESLNMSKNVENSLPEIPQHFCMLSSKVSIKTPVNFKPMELLEKDIVAPTPSVEEPSNIPVSSVTLNIPANNSLKLLEKDMVVPTLLVAESSSIPIPLVTLNIPENNSLNSSIVELPEFTTQHQLPSKVSTNTPVTKIQIYHQGMEHLTQPEQQPKHLIIDSNKVLKSTLSQHSKKKKSSFAMKTSELSAVQKLQHSTTKRRQKRKPYFVTLKQRYITRRNVNSKQNNEVKVLEQNLQQYQQLQPLTMTPPILPEVEHLQTVTKKSLNHQVIESLQQPEVFNLSNAEPSKLKSPDHLEDETLLKKKNILTEFSSQLPIIKKKRKRKPPPTTPKRITRQNVNLDLNNTIRIQEQDLQQHHILHTPIIASLKLPEVEQIQSVIEKPLLNLQATESLEQSESPKPAKLKLLDLSSSSIEYNYPENIRSPLTEMQRSKLLIMQKIKLSIIKEKLKKLMQKPFLTDPKRHITRQNVKLNQNSDIEVLESDFQQHYQLKPPIVISPKLLVAEQQQTVKKKPLNFETIEPLQQSESSKLSNAKPSIYSESLNQLKDKTLCLPSTEKQNIFAVHLPQLSIIKKKRKLKLPESASKRITKGITLQNVNLDENSKTNVSEQNLPQYCSLQHQTMRPSIDPVEMQLQSITAEKPFIPKVLKTVEQPESLTFLNMEPSIYSALLMSLNGKTYENLYLPSVENTNTPVVHSLQFPIIKKKQQLKPYLVAALKRITHQNMSSMVRSKVKALERDLQQYHQVYSPSIASRIYPKVKQLKTITNESLNLHAIESLQQSEILKLSNTESLKSELPNHSEDETLLVPAIKNQNISATYSPQLPIMKKQRKLKPSQTFPKRITRRSISSDPDNLEHSIIMSPKSEVEKQPYILQKKSMHQYAMKTLDLPNSPKSLIEETSKDSMPLLKSSVFPLRQLPVEKKEHFVNNQLNMTRITLHWNEFTVFENMEKSLVEQQKLQQEYPQYFYTSGPEFHKEIIRFTDWLHLKLIPIPLTTLKKTKILCQNKKDKLAKDNRIDRIVAQKLTKKIHQINDYLSNKHTKTLMTGIRKHKNVKCKLKALDTIISNSASTISTCSSEVCTTNFTTTFAHFLYPNICTPIESNLIRNIRSQSSKLKATTNYRSINGICTLNSPPVTTASKLTFKTNPKYCYTNPSITTEAVNKLVERFKLPRKNKGCRNLSSICPYC